MFLIRQSWKACPYYLLISISLWSKQQPIIGYMHCYHPARFYKVWLKRYGPIWKKVKEICPGTFLVSEGKNAYPCNLLTPCESVGQVGLTDLRKCKMFELPWHFFPPSYSYIFRALFKCRILTRERGGIYFLLDVLLCLPLPSLSPLNVSRL